MIIDSTQTLFERQIEHITPRHVKGCPGLFHLQGGIQVLARQHSIDGISYIGKDKCCCRDSMVPGSCSICHGCPFGTTDKDWTEFQDRNPGSFCSMAVWGGFKFRARHNYWESYAAGFNTQIINTIECRCLAINYLSPYMFDDGHDSYDRWCINCFANLFPNVTGEGSWEKIVSLGERFPRRRIRAERRIT